MTDESDHTRLVLIEQQVRDLRLDVQDMTQATHDLIEAWKSAKVLLMLIVFLAKVMTACGVIWLSVKGFRELLR